MIGFMYTFKGKLDQKGNKIFVKLETFVLLPERILQ